MSSCFSSHHSLNDVAPSRRLSFASMLNMILDAVIVASSLLLSAAGSSVVPLAASSSHPGVHDLGRLSSGLLQHDFRHFQLSNVRKLLDLSLTTAFLVPVHNMLSPSITIFGICCQNNHSTRVHVRNGSVPIEHACQHLVAFDVGLFLSLHHPNRSTRR